MSDGPIRLEFTVYGTPAQKGSVKAINKGQFAVVVPDNKPQQLQWQGAVSDKAAQAMDGTDLITEPVAIGMYFRFRRKQYHFGTGRNAGRLKKSAPDHHGRKPDLDKLARCVLDALTGVVYHDDSLFALSDGLSKRWTMRPEGVTITVRVLTAADLKEDS